MVDFFGWTSFGIFVPDTRSPSPCKNCQIAKLSNCGHIFRNQNAILSKWNDKISESLNKDNWGQIKMNSKSPSSTNKNLIPLLLCEGLKENDFFIILTFLSFVFLTVAYSHFCIYISVITDVPILPMYTFSYSNPTCFFIKPSNRERLK